MLTVMAVMNMSYSAVFMPRCLTERLLSPIFIIVAGMLRVGFTHVRQMGKTFDP